MAVGKNKRLSKGKKGLKKKAQDPFARKDWYGIKAPAPFAIRDVGKTLVNRTTGLKNANDAPVAKRTTPSARSSSVSTRSQELLTLPTTTSSIHLRSHPTQLPTLRLFAIAFTKRRPNQIKKTHYAASSQIRAIRRKMTEIIQREASSCTLTQLTSKLIPEVIGREIEKATQGIYPLQNVHIRKVKLLKQPKFDLGALMTLHGESSTDEQGQKVEREFREQVLESV
ncbi:ribosomal 40S subunit protein S1B [Staphylotrichum longicolle]|uniref:Ribosomal 40S subunit protein S1B n=1 Tax=Staphylotrichum longicolle TaxID=669026 RepID=A0AAD4EWN6_9PEZI|nr:ribosomal 40S subunit protein S1B [Staphylotrichum longicolle]